MLKCATLKRNRHSIPINQLKRRKVMFYLTTHLTHVLILLLYGVRHTVKDHSDRDEGNPLSPLHGLHFLISSKVSFICTDWIAHTTACYVSCGALVGTRNSSMGPP